jgi:hypothetical protein
VEEYFQLTTCNIGFDKQSLEPKDRLYLTHWYANLLSAAAHLSLFLPTEVCLSMK